MGRKERLDIIDTIGFTGKTCAKCNVTKDLGQFGVKKSHRTGYQSQCRECNRLDKRKRVTKELDAYLKRTYGISLAERDQMILDQHGLCKICKLKKPLHVDHDHVSGLVRGLLCGNCNRGLGIFQDDQELLRRAAIYLNQHGNTLAMVA